MTWILIKDIPPEVYGIDLKKWKKEQTTRIWSQRRVPKMHVQEFLQYGARIIQEGDKYVILEEPSVKEDTANKLFKLIEIRPRVDYLLRQEILKGLKMKESDIYNSRGYYSSGRKEKFSGYIIFTKHGKKGFKHVTKAIEYGSKQIIFLVQLYTDLDGVLLVSYEREKEGNYHYKGSIVSREYEGVLNSKLIKKMFKLPNSFHIAEDKIIEELYE